MLPAGVTVSRDMSPYASAVYAPSGPTPKAEYLVERVLFDSRDLPPQWANTFSGTFYLGNPTLATGDGQATIKNVVSVELRALDFPKVDGERYIIMDIPALNDGQLGATNSAAHRTFAVGYFDSDALTPGAHKPQKGTDFYQKIIKYDPPIAKLDRVSVSFKQHDGSVITAANVGGVANVSYSFILEITSVKNASRW